MDSTGMLHAVYSLPGQIRVVHFPSRAKEIYNRSDFILALDEALANLDGGAPGAQVLGALNTDVGAVASSIKPTSQVPFSDGYHDVLLPIDGEGRPIHGVYDATGGPPQQGIGGFVHAVYKNGHVRCLHFPTDPSKVVRDLDYNRALAEADKYVPKLAPGRGVLDTLVEEVSYILETRAVPIFMTFKDGRFVQVKKR